MPNFVETAQSHLETLAENPYPGRGIVLGMNQAADMAVQVYWLMGRSEGSRNRILVEDNDTVRTELFDKSVDIDTSLIIYNAMRKHIPKGKYHIVSNGDQTDTVVKGIHQWDTVEDSLSTRMYEPDAPNYTPRITGYTFLHGSETKDADYGLSIIRKAEDSEEAIRDNYRGPLNEASAGLGFCVHTYLGDGDPLPSFDKAPYIVPVAETIDETAEMYWDHLDRDNRVALVVKGIKLATNEATYRIINAHQVAE